MIIYLIPQSYSNISDAIKEDLNMKINHVEGRIITSQEQIHEAFIELKKYEIYLNRKINEKNRYSIKEAISNPERKAFVLVQAELSKFHIDYWEMRRQASDILVLLKRLNNCVKTLGFELKNFWLYFWAVKFQKYFTLRFWEHAEKQIMLQFSDLEPGSKDLNKKGKHF